jgi:hypothetical protein
MIYLFRDFLQKSPTYVQVMNFIPVKDPHYIYVHTYLYLYVLYERFNFY